MGYMGVGKTTVGKQLSERLSIPFVDTDVLIEEHECMSISQIFEKHGEPYFRMLEREAIFSAKEKKQSIISVGGGLPCNDENIKWINQHFYSVWLQLGVERIAKRLTKDKSRPLLRNKSATERINYMSQMLRERTPYYSQADVTVRAYGPEDKVADRIIKRLKL